MAFKVLYIVPLNRYVLKLSDLIKSPFVFKGGFRGSRLPFEDLRELWTGGKSGPGVRSGPKSDSVEECRRDFSVLPSGVQNAGNVSAAVGAAGSLASPSCW